MSTYLRITTILNHHLYSIWRWAQSQHGISQAISRQLPPSDHTPCQCTLVPLHSRENLGQPLVEVMIEQFVCFVDYQVPKVAQRWKRLSAYIIRDNDAKIRQMILFLLQPSPLHFLPTVCSLYIIYMKSFARENFTKGSYVVKICQAHKLPYWR